MSNYGEQAYGSSPQIESPRSAWERTPKWHWRCWLLRQTWRLMHYYGPNSYGERETAYKTEVQMAKHNLARRYDPNLQGRTEQRLIRDLEVARGMKPNGGRRARI
jgi:hypothetical protein